MLQLVAGHLKVSSARPALLFLSKKEARSLIVGIRLRTQAQGPSKEGKKRVWVDIGGGTGELAFARATIQERES